MANPVDLATRPAIHPSVAWVEVGGEVVLTDRRTGGSHLLSPSAALLWQVFDGSATVDELAGEVADAFGIGIDRARSDVTALAEQLMGFDLLTDGPAPPEVSGSLAEDDEVRSGDAEVEATPRYLPEPPDH